MECVLDVWHPLLFCLVSRYSSNGEPFESFELQQYFYCKISCFRQFTVNISDVVFPSTFFELFKFVRCNFFSSILYFQTVRFNSHFYFFLSIPYTLFQHGYFLNLLFEQRILSLRHCNFVCVMLPFFRPNTRALAYKLHKH